MKAIRRKITPIIIGFVPLGLALIALTRLITASEVAIITVGVILVGVGGVLSAIYAEETTPVARD